jgi:predicted dehydrogenase
LLGSEGQIAYSADDNAVRVWSVGSPTWMRHELERGQAQAGYINPEEPYIAEMRDFLGAVAGEKRFPNTLLDDYRVLRILETLESRSVTP